MSVNLCIDWGNTNVKLAVFTGDKVSQHFSVPASEAREKILSVIGLFNPTKAILCAVGDTGKDIDRFIGDRIDGYVRMDGYTNLPIHNAYLSNDTIGADRLALVAAANALNPDKNNLVISIGTCITYNFITKNKTFRGGAISPGLQMRLQAMHQLTHKLPEVAVDGDLLLLGYDTATCMRSGAVYGIVGELDSILQQYEAAYADFNAILTGGDAAFFAGRTKSKIFADPDLLLKGLNLILNHNVPLPR
jgi:type III pantothenate kinase